MLNKLTNINWDFPEENTQYLTHTYHKYPARFIPQIPKTLIKFLTKKGETILDPFCGCGTTLVESQLAERKAIGIDLNPLACLISKVKTTPIEQARLVRFWEKFRRETKEEVFSSRKGAIDSFIKENKNQLEGVESKAAFKLPKRRISDKFTGEIQQDLWIIKNCIDEIGEQDLADFFKVGLSSVVFACQDTRAKGFSVWRAFERKIGQMNKQMAEYNKALGKLSEIPIAEIFEADARQYPEEISEDSVDLVITSPTYVNVFDYYRIHIYNIIVLDLDYEIFRKREMGAHRRFKENRFRLLTEYLADMFRAIAEMNRVTKENGYVGIVIGDSCVEFERIKNCRHFIEMGEKAGLEHLKTATRKIDPGSKYANRVIGNIDDEHLIFFKATNRKKELTEEKILETITEIMKKYQEHIKTSNGTCLRDEKELSEERLRENQEKIRKAIEKIPKDSRNRINLK